jgi:riboflavin kinase/FMN adenylyltransferase
MIIFRALSELSDFGPVVATIGNFDGVHRGHRWVIDQVNERARVLGMKSLAITFDPHPVRVLRPDAPHSLITPLEQKLELLAGTGVDATLVLPFTPELSRLSAEAFAREVLYDACHIREVHEGETFRFGYGGKADMHGLETLGQQLGFAVVVYSPQILRGLPVSSSRIRALIAAGDVSHARGLLGRSFTIRGKPASGRGFGTRYTVPTINLAPYPELLPGIGVYVTTLKVGSDVFQAVTNVGNRPTFGEDSFTVESHLLDFHPVELLEDSSLELTFMHRLRPEIRWPTPEALREQIGKDVKKALRFFSLCQMAAATRQ